MKEMEIFWIIQSVMICVMIFASDNNFQWDKMCSRKYHSQQLTLSIQHVPYQLVTDNDQQMNMLMSGW